MVDKVEDLSMNWFSFVPLRAVSQRIRGELHYPVGFVSNENQRINFLYKNATDFFAGSVVFTCYFYV